MIRQQRRFLPLLCGRCTCRRSITSLALLVLIVISLPALSGAQQACQSDGDVNQDGSVTAADALLAFRQALSLVQLDTCQQNIADVFPQPAFPDGSITASDALCIFQKALSLPSCLNILPPANQLPTVNAGPGHSVDEGTVVTLSGTASDPDGTIVSYLWEQTGGTMVLLASADDLVATFTAPDASADETLTFRLTVTDDDGAQASDELSVTVRPVNLPPVVIADVDQSFAEIDGLFFLIGTASDPDGTIVSYLWEQTGGTMVLLASADDLVATFAAPDVSADETLTFRLTVTDDDGAQASDELSVTVRPINLPPVVIADVDQSFAELGQSFAEIDGLFFLIGTASDPDGTIVSYLWEQTGGTMVLLASADDLVATFAAPDVSADETLTFRLTVTDDDGAQASDELSVTVRPVNLPPVVIVEEAFPSVAEAGVIVFLIGTASDPDGTIVSYLWEQTDGTMVSLADADSPTAMFTAPDVSVDETLTFGVTVVDDDGAMRRATVSVTVTAIPSSPGTISGTLSIGEGSVLDSDIKVAFDPAAENNSLQGQSLGLAFPVTVAGHVNDLDDNVDIYRITLLAPTDILLKIGDWPAADLDLYLANTSGEIIDASIGGKRFESIEIGDGSQQEFLVTVHAPSGASNYVLSFGMHDPSTFSRAGGEGLRLDSEFVANEAIVELTEELDSAQADALLGSILGDVEFAESVASPSGIILIELQDMGAAQLDSELGDSSVGPLRYATPEMAEKARTLQTIKRLGSDPDVSFAEPNFIAHTLLIPDDPRYSDQWHYPLVNLPAAWDITIGSDDVVIAVIDTGIRPHADIWDRVLRETRFIGPGPGDVIGYDFVRLKANPGDGDGIDPDPIEPVIRHPDQGYHGTHVAGTIGAETNNGQGVAGVTWRGKIMPLRALNPRGGGNSYDLAQAIYYAAGLANNSRSLPSRRADIINMSIGLLGGKCESKRIRALENAIKQALDSGVHVVVAAGNDNCDEPEPMSTIDGVITVSAVDENRRKARFSNYGRKIDVAAPGVKILSTVSDHSQFPSVKSDYKRKNGTSMAAPHVAGVLALMLSVNPDLTPDDINRLLAGTHPHVSAGPITRDLGAPGRDDVFGHGLIDALKAVRAAQELLPAGHVRLPKLSVSPDILNFGEYRTQAFTHVANANDGSGELIIRSVTTDKPWLVVEDYNPLPSSYPYLDLRVDRTGLRQGDHNGHVFITSNGGDRIIRVTVTVRSSLSGGNAGQAYIIVIDPVTLEPVAQATTDAAQRYEYRTPEVPAGAYLVVAGTDRDDDGFICDPGEACGAWPAVDAPHSVEVDGDQAGVDIPVFLDLIAGPDEPPLKGFLPMGIRRLPEPDFPVTTLVSVGLNHTCMIRDTGYIECQGDNRYGQSTPPSGTFISVSVGGDHTCGMGDTGTVECWGDDFHGESTPPAGTFASVSAGHDHTCGVRATGAVECWGSNETFRGLAPFPVYTGQAEPPGDTFDSVSAGYDHTCGVRSRQQDLLADVSSSNVVCWGDDSQGESTPPSGIFVSVSAGSGHTCGIRDTGAVECWGANSYGQSTPPSGTFISVSAGFAYTCGLRDTGTVECWGDDSSGQSTPPSGTFTSVNTGSDHICGVRRTGTVECWGFDASPSGTFVSVSAGSYHSCGIRDTGAVKCWGANSYGQSTPPTGTFTSISAGSSHTCGIRETGVVECWGDDYSGESSPPAGKFTSVSAGNGHTCGVRGTGAVVCWGSGFSGFVGPGTPPLTQPLRTFISISVSVGFNNACAILEIGPFLDCWGGNQYGQSTPPADAFNSVSAGSDHFCGIRNTGAVVCWGHNSHGQSTPPAGTFASVSAGSRHTCGIRDTGVVECWGANFYGQSIPPAGMFASVSAGSGHTCGIRDNGAVACWGSYVNGLTNSEF